MLYEEEIWTLIAQTMNRLVSFSYVDNSQNAKSLLVWEDVKVNGFGKD